MKKFEGEKYIQARKTARRLKVPNHPKEPEIEHGIPFPPRRGGTRKFDCFYPLEKLQPGDSFWVPSTTQCTAGAVSKFAKKSGWKFMTSGQSMDGRGNKVVNVRSRGTRVWRVE